MAAKAGGSFFSSAAGKEWRNYLMSAFAIACRSLSNVYPADLTFIGTHFWVRQSYKGFALTARY
jgi:hypothetical protein